MQKQEIWMTSPFTIEFDIQFCGYDNIWLHLIPQIPLHKKEYDLAQE